MYLLDTNICIYAMNNKYPSVSEKLFSISAKDIYISTVVISELQYSAVKSKWGERSRNIMNLFLYVKEFSRIPDIKIQDWTGDEI